MNIEIFGIRIIVESTKGYSARKVNKEIKEFLSNDDFIGAIRFYRNATGGRLADAKEYVEKIRGY